MKKIVNSISFDTAIRCDNIGVSSLTNIHSLLKKWGIEEQAYYSAHQQHEHFFSKKFRFEIMEHNQCKK